MGKASDRLYSRYHFAFDYALRSFELISSLFVWERETLAAVLSTHDYGFWSNRITNNSLLFPICKVFNYLWN